MDDAIAYDWINGPMRYNGQAQTIGEAVACAVAMVRKEKRHPASIDLPSHIYENLLASLGHRWLLSEGALSMIMDPEITLLFRGGGTCGVYIGSYDVGTIWDKEQRKLCVIDFGKAYG